MAIRHKILGLKGFRTCYRQPKLYTNTLTHKILIMALKNHKQASKVFTPVNVRTEDNTIIIETLVNIDINRYHI